MSDTPPPVQPVGPAGDAAAALSPEAVERVLADFRAWLGELAEPPARAADSSPPVDLHTLVAQFTALRHEVNLQTKAARTSIEQTGSTKIRGFSADFGGPDAGVALASMVVCSTSASSSDGVRSRP